jgi:hypothetical protein
MPRMKGAGHTIYILTSTHDQLTLITYSYEPTMFVGFLKVNGDDMNGRGLL